MINQEVYEITILYNESVDEVSASGRPQYLIFAEKIISRELELMAKLLCFQCAQGNKAEKLENRKGWSHRIVGTSGYELIETCRANGLRIKRERHT